MNDRTVIRPGGRRPNPNTGNEDKTVVRSNPRAQPRSPQPARYAADPMAQQDERPRQPRAPMRSAPEPMAEPTPINDNPLLELVAPLISLVSKVNNAREQVDVEELRRHAILQIEEFRQVNFYLPNNPQLVTKASYGLCCLLDELVLNTPWGAQSTWSTESLLVYFHQEAWGGENFFMFLDELSTNPSSNFGVLELYYVALDMGFEGKYRQLPNGQREVSNVANDLFVLLGRYRGQSSAALSPRWQGIAESKNSLLKLVPQWVVWSVASGIAILAFIGLSILLGNQADPVQRRLATLPVQQAVVVTPANLSQLGQTTFQTSVEPDLIEEQIDYFSLLSNALEFEQRNNMVVIENLDEGTLVRLVDANLFRSGSDVIANEFATVVEKIGTAISQDRVQIEVTGHTDNVPIRTLRFGSNWDLSAARAETVRQILTETLHPNSRVGARGMADTKAIASNATPEGRSKNRRVEILVLN